MGWNVWNNMPAKNGVAFYWHLKRQGLTVQRRIGGGVAHVALWEDEPMTTPNRITSEIAKMLGTIQVYGPPKQVVLHPDFQQALREHLAYRNVSEPKPTLLDYPVEVDPEIEANWSLRY